ncbi:MAG TPA: ComEC/Rec2 family competence protein [Planctomycetota bacterium]|nr:ComEC/Rec2 family competence protein [Planctomycetota bacterium]
MKPSPRPAVPLALAALSGVVLGGVVPGGAVLPAIAAGALALLAVARRSTALVLLSVIVLGVARRMDARSGEATVLDHDAFALVRGSVASEPSPRFGGSSELLFEVEDGTFLPASWRASQNEPASGPGPCVPAGTRVRARIAASLRKRAGDLLPGRRLELAGTLKAPLEPRRPDGYDLAHDLRREGACAVLEVEECWRLDGLAFGPASLVARLGRRARWAIRDAHLGRDEEAVVRALVLGDRQGLAPSLREAFRATALVHAITVSGLHVAALAWVLGALVRPLPVRIRGLGVALGLAFYLGLAGPHPGVLRAAIAGALLALAQGFGRGGDSWNRLAVALLAVLAYDPASVEEPGFQLTFGTVSGVLGLAPVLRRWLGKGRLRGELATSIAGFLAHAPFVLARFGQVAPVAIVANVPALPLTTATLVLGLLGTGLGLLHHSLGRPLLLLAGLGAKGLLALVELAAKLPPLALPHPSPVATALALGLLVLGFHGERRSVFALGLLLWIASLLPAPRAVPPKIDVVAGETIVTGRTEQLSESVYRIEHGGEAALLLDDASGKELTALMAAAPEGKLRASVLVIRGHTTRALERFVEHAHPLVVVAASRPLKRKFTDALEGGAWSIVVDAPLRVERYDAGR